MVRRRLNVRSLGARSSQTCNDLAANMPKRSKAKKSFQELQEESSRRRLHRFCMQLAAIGTLFFIIAYVRNMPSVATSAVTTASLAMAVLAVSSFSRRTIVFFSSIAVYCVLMMSLLFVIGVTYHPDSPHARFLGIGASFAITSSLILGIMAFEACRTAAGLSRLERVLGWTPLVSVGVAAIGYVLWCFFSSGGLGLLPWLTSIEFWKD